MNIKIPVLLSLMFALTACGDVEHQMKEPSSMLLEKVFKTVEHQFAMSKHYGKGQMNEDFIGSSGKFLTHFSELHDEVKVVKYDNEVHFYHPEIGVFDIEGHDKYFSINVARCSIETPKCETMTEHVIESQ